MPDSEQVNCMCCGEPADECRCDGCPVFGSKRCEHLLDWSVLMLKKWSESIRRFAGKPYEEDEHDA